MVLRPGMSRGGLPAGAGAARAGEAGQPTAWEEYFPGEAPGRWAGEAGADEVVRGLLGDAVVLGKLSQRLELLEWLAAEHPAELERGVVLPGCCSGPVG
jgi:hypothetical protein